MEWMSKKDFKIYFETSPAEEGGGEAGNVVAWGGDMDKSEAFHVDRGNGHGDEVCPGGLKGGVFL